VRLQGGAIEKIMDDYFAAATPMPEMVSSMQ
jgi:hypothetical protein